MEYFWLLVSLLILAGIIAYTGAHKMILGVLDDHSKRVRAELDEAQKLRDEAQTLLADQQKQLAGGKDRAKEIIQHAKTEVERQTRRHHEEIEASLQRRTEQALARIAQEESRSVQELRAYAAQIAVRTSERLLSERLGAKAGQTLLDDAIDEVSRKLA